MGADDGKLLYRRWLTPRSNPNNGPLLHVSPPTGDGEMVCSMERDYYLNFTTGPSYNNRFYANYDGTYSYDYANYSSTFDGSTLYNMSEISSLYLDKAYPHNGIIPLPNSVAAEGIFRTGTFYYHDDQYPDSDDQWPFIIKPFMFIYSIYVDKDGAGNKIYVMEVTHQIFMFQYPSTKEISEGTSPPKDPASGNVLTFSQVATVVSNWTYDNWFQTYSQDGYWSGWSLFVGYLNRLTMGWNYRKKGYGLVMPMTPATPTWTDANGVMQFVTANRGILQNQGSFNISIV